MRTRKQTRIRQMIESPTHTIRYFSLYAGKYHFSRKAAIESNRKNKWGLPSHAYKDAVSTHQWSQKSLCWVIIKQGKLA